MRNAVRANIMKQTPPIRVTVLTEILVATNRPPITARPVHRVWPIRPAMTIAERSSLAARTMVAS